MSETHGPVGKTRNPVVVTLISMICFIYAIIELFGMLGELKAFRQKDDINVILFLIPILQIIELLKLSEKVSDAKKMAGCSNTEAASPILYLLLGIYFLPADLNEVWAAAGGGQAAPGA